jgi:uncharacterized membrane protein YbhN (UPF0104 family)
MIVLAFYGYSLAGQWGELAALSATVRPAAGALALSGVLVLAAYVVLIETWRRTVQAWGGHLRWSQAARIWFISNLGKYVPGGIWQIASMGVMAQEHGVSPTAAIGSSLVVNLVNLLAGCVVTAIAGGAALGGPGFLPLAVTGAVVAIATPWLLPWGARLASRLTKRDIPEPRVPVSAIFLALAGCSVAWVLYGISFRLLATSLFGAPSGTVASYIAVFTLAYVIGYAVLFAPGGFGPREYSLTKFLPLAHLESGANAALLVIASRLWLTLLEAAPGLIWLAVGRLANQTPSTQYPDSSNGS